ncbi:MAG: dTMP kinase [Myxococcota bacterium]|nr:dTMP kinase [Myxococcota bacterium]
MTMDQETQGHEGLTALPGADAFLPEALIGDFQGKLIVVEGPDGSGRTTHITLLQDWLEWRGYAVTIFGLKRSKLLGKDLSDLAASNEVQPLTRLLLYATDFYDQLERTVLPALRAGFVVLADRSEMTLACRAAVRGIGRDYLANLFHYVVEPDLKILLDVPPEKAFQRLFHQRQKLSHLEFGGDIAMGKSVYENFMSYQKRIRTEFHRVGDRDGFTRVNADRSVQVVSEDLRRLVAETLGIEETKYRPSEHLLHVWNQTV